MDILLSEDAEKAESLKGYLLAREAKRTANPVAQFEMQALEMETHFEKLCYLMVKENSRKNGAGLTIEQLQCMSVYSFYTLKKQLISDK